MESDPPGPLARDHERDGQPPSGYALVNSDFPGNVTPLDATVGSGFVGRFLVALIAILKRRFSWRRYDNLDR